tara:strand:+ start:4103 stop:4999 length:897 start_codon:yes stop_codon:yes gene_type:complete
MNDNLSNLTVIILTFNTKIEILKNCLDSIDDKTNILLVENSNDFENKKELLSKYQNLKIICTGSNLGYGGGNNYGLKNIKTDYALILNPDTKCESNFFLNINKYLNNNIDFTIIGSTYENESNYKSAGFFNNKNTKNKNFIEDYNLYEADWVVGCSVLINMKKFSDNNFFDENFFLFWEEFDLCKRVKNKNENVYVSKDLKINHLGFQSSLSKDKEFEIDFIKLRNWHYMWSFFYFHKKHFGFFNAFFKSLGRFLRSIFRIMFYTFTFNKKERIIYTYRFLGLLNSILNRKSYFRIKL